jgi:hypothetical protein
MHPLTINCINEQQFTEAAANGMAAPSCMASVPWPGRQCISVPLSVI